MRKHVLFFLMGEIGMVIILVIPLSQHFLGQAFINPILGGQRRNVTPQQRWGGKKALTTQ